MQDVEMHDMQSFHYERLYYQVCKSSQNIYEIAKYYYNTTLTHLTVSPS